MTTYKEIFGKPIKVLTGDPAPTPITYTVTVANPGSGNVYYIDGVQTPTLELYEGNTYNFDYSAATGHPFRFATAADAAGSTEYTTGVSVDSNITTIVVASGAPNLFYYCTNHSGMGGRALTPAGPNEYEGQIWYNETTGKFRSVVASGTWSSATSLPETNSNAGGAGIQTAALFFGGRSGGAQKTQTLEYNGLGYSAGGAMGTARTQMGSGGTQTAAVAATGDVEGGPTTTATEEYGGTSWTAGGSVSTARFASGGAGTQTALVIAGGRLAPGTWSAVTEEYDGTSWTNGGALNQSKTLGGSMTGSLTATVSFGGDGNPPTAAVNDLTFYDGTSWTETGNIPTATRNPGSGGPQTAAIYFGGKAPSETANTFLFDGTSFSATGSMGAATYIMAPAANASNNNTALSMGGYGGSAYLSRTEEYNFTTNTVVQAAWSSGGTANTAAYNLGGAGTQTAALAMGGANSTGTGSLTSTEEYDGSSWTNAEDLPGATSYTGGCGTQTAALLAGGANIPAYASTTSRHYDGTNWTAGGTMNTATGSAGQLAGILTAALIAGGDRVPGAPRSIANAEEYNGSSWTSVTSLPAVRQYSGVAGIQTAALYWGGYGDTNPGTPNTQYNTTLEYDGTNWTSGGVLPSARKSAGGSGTQTDALSIGGNPGTTPTNITQVLNYNGTSWATYPSLANGRQHMASSSSTPRGTSFAAKGVTTAVTATTEEFTAETTSLNKVNISSS